ncbi:hypothetical protein E8E14_002642 [Neopestalotiopsis sp. 37M]|nr:hypothetical protein E8E14_002642 [Neopestalotiopsis sp. 37M]
MNPPQVVAVIGAGGIGLAVARRLAPGRTLFLADNSEKTLTTAKETLQKEGYSVETRTLDVSDPQAVVIFAKETSIRGHLAAVVSTAGLSPSSSSKLIFNVNLVGTAAVIEAFLRVAQSGTSLVCISSMAGHMGPPPSQALRDHLATAPVHQLLQHDELALDTVPHMAYTTTKNANLIRVQAAARAYGRKGARINSVSPGVISTDAGREQIAAGAAKFVAASPAGRVGTPQDIVNAVAFLVSADAAFITGTDILVDGGVVAAYKFPETA